MTMNKTAVIFFVNVSLRNPTFGFTVCHHGASFVIFWTEFSVTPSHSRYILNNYDSIRGTPTLYMLFFPFDKMILLVLL